MIFDRDAMSNVQGHKLNKKGWSLEGHDVWQKNNSQ